MQFTFQRAASALQKRVLLLLLLQGYEELRRAASSLDSRDTFPWTFAPSSGKCARIRLIEFAFGGLLTLRRKKIVQPGTTAGVFPFALCIAKERDR
jgi:hypothetical protein